MIKEIILHSIFISSFLLLLSTQSKAQDVDQWNKDMSQFYAEYVIDGKVKYKDIDDKTLAYLAKHVEDLENIEFSNLTQPERVALLTNTYNLLVIKKVVENYPIASVKAIPGFFTDPQKVGSLTLSLNELEQYILSESEDPRFHFALVCGAISCPALFFINEQNLKNQLATAEKNFFKNSNFIKVDEENQSVKASKIFNWYAADFGGRKYIDESIKKYLDIEVADYSLSYAVYDWRLNEDKAVKQIRYQPTLLYTKGAREVKLFSNYYTQKEPVSDTEDELRYTFFTNTLQYVEGTKKGFNIGPVIRFRSVQLEPLSTARYFHATRFQNNNIDGNTFNAYARTGISAAGLQFRHERTSKKEKRHLIIHTLLFPTVQNAEGDGTFGFLDWDGLQYTIQTWRDKDIGPNLNIFFDFGFIFENIHPDIFTEDPLFFQITSNNVAIINWFLYPRMTLYGIASISPQLGIFTQSGNTNTNIGGFGQLGVGYKYFITDTIELELLGTLFQSTVFNRQSQTVNVGIRYALIRA